MTDQLALFTAPAARRTDPDTSHAAAKAVKPEALEACILEALAMYQRIWGGGMTDQQLVAHLKYDPEGSVVTARSRLFKRGLVVADGTRTNTRNREMTVWRIATDTRGTNGNRE